MLVTSDYVIVPHYVVKNRVRSGPLTQVANLWSRLLSCYLEPAIAMMVHDVVQC